MCDNCKKLEWQIEHYKESREHASKWAMEASERVGRLRGTVRRAKERQRQAEIEAAYFRDTPNNITAAQQAILDAAREINAQAVLEEASYDHPFYALCMAINGLHNERATEEEMK